MKHFLLNVIVPGDGEPPPPPALAKIMADLGEVRAAMKAAGHWVFSAGLEPPAASSVVGPGEADLVHEGPFAESKEFVGGFTLIRAADLAEARAWAKKLAAAITLPIEVRPVRDFDG